MLLLLLLLLLLQVLDRMLLYLRIVHSIDFYGVIDYENEDEMPHRCGMMHARSAPPTTPPTDSEGTGPYLLHFSKAQTPRNARLAITWSTRLSANGCNARNFRL